MSHEKYSEKEQNIDRIIHTSVADAKSSLSFVTDLCLLRACLDAERSTFNRTSMIKNIESRIRKLEREQK